MVNFTIDLTAPEITGSLKEDNLRGEPRWERQATEALVEAGATVRALRGGSWTPASEKPPNLNFGVNEAYKKDSVYLCHDFHTDIIDPGLTGNTPPYRALISNLFSVHYLVDARETIDRYVQELGNRFFFTQGYLQGINEKHILDVVPEENYECLPVPGIPRVVPGDNFNKKKILWNSRAIMSYLIPGSHLKDIRLAFRWVAKILENNKAMEFFVMTGMGEEDLNFIRTRESKYVGCKTVEDLFWSTESAQCLAHLKPQINILSSLSWQQTLDLMADTKITLSITQACHGGPPVETAMYGIPWIGPKNGGAFKAIPGRLAADRWRDYINLTDQVFHNQDLYRRHGDLHREFVKKHHTYEAFTNNLFRILKERGIE